MNKGVPMRCSSEMRWVGGEVGGCVGRGWGREC